MKWINRNRKLLKYISVLMIFSLLMDLVAPLAASALTNGPGQVEVQSFEPAATTQMVNLFTGDFVYNIPLMDVGGYPINIAYHAGIGMEQEASWVGLGWNINPGAVSRNMRGLPDDFKGDPVTKILNFKDNVTKGILAGTGFQFTLWKLGVQVDIGLGAFMNTYRGAGFEAYTNATAGIGWLKAGLGISYNTQSGLGINPSLGFSGGLAGGTLGLGGQLSTSYNTREGVKYFSFGGGASVVGIPSRGSTQISLGTQTYTPRIPFNMKSRNSAIRGAVGPFVLGAFPYFFVKGYSSRNFLDVNTKVLNGYGYLYTEAGVDNPDALLDFNREKEGNFTDETPNLPITNFTYDVYTATAQGMGGMYRPHRNEIGTLSDPRMSEDGSGWTTNLDAGFGDIVHAGVGQAIVFTSGFSEKWQGSTNPAGDRLKFQDEGSADYETYYFKNAGEKTIFDETFYTPYGGIKPIKVKIELDNKNIVTLNQFKRKLKDKVYSTLAIPANNYQTNREKRNQLFTFLNADDASNFGLTKRLRTYTLNTSYQADTLPYDTLSRVVNRKRAKHHISEVTILRPDGNKYVYGIPVYTYGQEEVSFNISANPQIFSCDTGLIAYTHDGSKADNSLKNDNGVDNFYSKTIIPPYATSFLLTAVLSSDYVDVSGNGPTDDDLGNFTKINYTRVIGNDAGATNYYEWRIPFSEKPPTNNHYPKATFSEGFKSNKKDDLAHYLHGKKEIWHVHSIETKNFIAEFTLEDRDDGFGVKGENGEINTSKSLKRLKEINLYNKEDRISGFAVPIKTVHFEYDYSLCTGVFNNKNYDPNSRGVANRGKLTLKKIYFTYGKSNRGKLSPYRFHYADNDHNGTIDANPNYNPMDMDRWGVYKPNNCTLTNADYPYADQDQATANDNAVSWCLTSIDLPSGSTMEITYESDDYAYVQNKRAMQMFKIKGIGQSSSSPLDKNRLHPGNLAYIFFEIDTLLSGSNLKDSLRLKYFEGIKYLYFKCLVDLTGKTDVEYVPGYAEIDDYGVYGSSPYTHAWVKLKPVGIKDDGKGDKVNPIVKAAIQFTRLNLPRLIYPDVDSATCGNIFSCLKQSISIDIQTIFGGGLNEALMDEGYAEALGLDKSWIRLLNPNKKKLGGGLRVSKITMDDSWSTMGGSSDFTYGQTYNYTRKEGGVWISSGVAAYEPIIGNEENPFRQPVFFDIKNVLAPDDHHYQEEPFGESHFPAPIVGYKVVRVTNLQHENVNRTATGYVQYQFYTAKDFPTFTHKTDLSPVNLYFKANPLQFLLRIRDRDYKGVSQGFTIEKNNMHGKLKARKTFAEDQNWPISSIQYFYKTDPLQSNLLSNKASVIFKDGTIGENTIGQDMEIVSDMTFKETNLNTYDFESSFNVFYLGVILSNFSIAFSDYHARTRFQSTVMTKVINRYALLDRIITNELGSISTFRNLAYDANTGEVLLTSKENEFEDPIYNFTHPVHWAYDRMGQAYKNIGVRFE
ncbi:MAG: hypothetical protein IIA45_04325 [Bacteroidetes bacterium]|nr:hypothetical protein [Bacteroidota bacterium]